MGLTMMSDLMPAATGLALEIVVVVVGIVAGEIAVAIVFRSLELIDIVGVSVKLASTSVHRGKER